MHVNMYLLRLGEQRRDPAEANILALTLRATLALVFYAWAVVTVAIARVHPCPPPITSHTRPVHCVLARLARRRNSALNKANNLVQHVL
jgi:hypothetical protein